MLDILQQVSSAVFSSWFSSTLWWPFWGRLPRVPHHLKYLALVIYGSWCYAGHFATGIKRIPFLLIYCSSICGQWGIHISHGHIHQVWHGRPPVSWTGSYTTWRHTVRNWFPFQITWKGSSRFILSMNQLHNTFAILKLLQYAALSLFESILSFLSCCVVGSHNLVNRSLERWFLHCVIVWLLCLTAPDLDGEGPGSQAWWETPGAKAESLGRGWSMKSLVFLRIVNIYDIILWRHICYLKCNKTLWCNMIFHNDHRCETVTNTSARRGWPLCHGPPLRP